MLDQLSPRPGAQRPRKRRRGNSGGGRYCGRGVKGQGKRSPGRETAFHFEGGQTPLVRRLPKRGFHNLFRVEYSPVNLRDLAGFASGTTVDVAALQSLGLVRGKALVKLLAEGDAPSGLKVLVHKASAAARQKIEAAGGSVELIG